MATKKDGYRSLTAGEVRMARSLFGDMINYGHVKVYKGSYFPFDLQDEGTAVTPNGNMYWPEPIFKEDFSLETPLNKNWFMHEFVHIWQHQMGMSVRTRGLISKYVNYHYSLPKEKTLADYRMEQQGNIIADYYTLINEGYNTWKDITSFEGIHGPDLLAKYQHTLQYFLASPRDKRSLWK
ncbi:hypothetical protein [Cronobacter dublinensis]|uniref:hypothetical protein n=1 Tax=Cronobacter dublinensis TaxID=413497 RepID=UPI0018F8A1B1|nr:hypothetical protein [Cronobacter dublinensis]